MEDEVRKLHEEHTGVLSTKALLEVRNKEELGMAYTPGVAELSKLIHKNVSDAKKYTMSGKLVAVITDGSAVLGLGNIGPEAGLPIVEGKALLYKTFADVDAIPLAVNQGSADDIVRSIEGVSRSFAGIHLEDIAAPKCFEIEEELQKRLNIPVYHDDQEGTAMAVLAGLINASHLVQKDLATMKIVLVGIGASGVATAKLLLAYGAKNLVLVDQQGILKKDDETLNRYQKELLQESQAKVTGTTLADAMVGADVVIGLSAGHIVTKEMVETMADQPIVFALANPVPEIEPEEAGDGGAVLVATGSSKHPNQINNVLVFPGLYRGLIQSGLTQVSLPLQINVSEALAKMIQPTVEAFIPNVFDEGVADVVTEAVVNFRG